MVEDELRLFLPQQAIESPTEQRGIRGIKVAPYLAYPHPLNGIVIAFGTDGGSESVVLYIAQVVVVGNDYNIVALQMLVEWQEVVLIPQPVDIVVCDVDNLHISMLS